MPHSPLLRSFIAFLTTIFFSHSTLLQAQESKPSQPRPASTTVKVFILIGDDPMVGSGEIGPEETPGTLAHVVGKKGRFPHLRDASGAWAVRKDVRYVHVYNEDGKMKAARNEWLTVGEEPIGPELQFGHLMGDRFEDPILLIKACRSGRSLGWDMLPPGSPQFTVDGLTYAGYKDTAPSWVAGSTPKPASWHAGKEYDIITSNIRRVLANLSTYYPGQKRHQIAGIVWWQGHKDVQSPVYTSRYEWNLAQSIIGLRNSLNAPKAQFVIAGYGVEGKAMKEPALSVLKAQLAVGDPAMHPGFAGTVASFDTRPFWHPPSASPKTSPHHYNRNAETFLDVGQAMGEAMIKLLDSKKP